MWGQNGRRRDVRQVHEGSYLVWGGVQWVQVGLYLVVGGRGGYQVTGEGGAGGAD